MTGDPYVVFAAGADYKREGLHRTWPELAGALDRTTPDARGPMPCALFHTDNIRPPATGRTSLNGTPACADHLAYATPPGGYPLKLQNPKDYQR